MELIKFKSDESISDRYGHGECHAFTAALKNRFPNAEIWVLDSNSPDLELIHSFIVINGTAYDAYGPSSIEDKIKQYQEDSYARRASNDEIMEILEYLDEDAIAHVDYSYGTYTEAFMNIRMRDKYLSKISFLHDFLISKNLHAEADMLLKLAGKYTIRAGDTPYRLSGGDHQYQMAIEKANPQIKDWTKIQIGQRIELPSRQISHMENAAFTIKAVNLIKGEEKLILHTYPDYGWAAIGYGHRYRKMTTQELARQNKVGTPIIGTKDFETKCRQIFQSKFKTIDETTATKYLSSDLNVAIECIKINVQVVLTQCQVNALVSFIYNTGCQKFVNTILPAINSGNPRSAAKMIANYGSNTGRRSKESEMFRGTR